MRLDIRILSEYRIDRVTANSIILIALIFAIFDTNNLKSLKIV